VAISPVQAAGKTPLNIDLDRLRGHDDLQLALFFEVVATGIYGLLKTAVARERACEQKNLLEI
jgi:hypothetical protein